MNLKALLNGTNSVKMLSNCKTFFSKIVSSGWYALSPHALSPHTLSTDGLREHFSTAKSFVSSSV